MSPDTIITYIPCLWCGEVQKWYGKGGTPQVLSAGRMCPCREIRKDFLTRMARFVDPSTATKFRDLPINKPRRYAR